MYVNFLSTYSDKKSCHTSTTLQTSSARFVSDSWASCTVHLTVITLICRCSENLWLYLNQFHPSPVVHHQRISFIKIIIDHHQQHHHHHLGFPLSAAENFSKASSLEPIGHGRSLQVSRNQRELQKRHILDCRAIYAIMILGGLCQSVEGGIKEMWKSVPFGRFWIPYF